MGRLLPILFGQRQVNIRFFYTSSFFYTSTVNTFSERSTG